MQQKEWDFIQTLLSLIEILFSYILEYLSFIRHYTFIGIMKYVLADDGNHSLIFDASLPLMCIRHWSPSRDQYKSGQSRASVDRRESIYWSMSHCVQCQWISFLMHWRKNIHRCLYTIVDWKHRLNVQDSDSVREVRTQPLPWLLKLWPKRMNKYKAEESYASQVS